MLCIEELLNVDDEVKRRVERQFDCFCKRVMTHHLSNCRKRDKRRNELEGSLTGYEHDEDRSLWSFDAYFVHEDTIDVCGIPVIISDERLLDAFNGLSEHDRNIIVLSVGLGFADREIGEALGMSRSSVQRKRAAILKRFAEARSPGISNEDNDKRQYDSVSCDCGGSDGRRRCAG